MFLIFSSKNKLTLLLLKIDTIRQQYALTLIIVVVVSVEISMHIVGFEFG
jgi:hypothetical protein